MLVGFAPERVGDRLLTGTAPLSIREIIALHRVEMPLSRQGNG